MNLPELLLPEKYRESYFIAGGYAICPALADDIDIWVQADVLEPEDLAAVRDEILAYLNTQLEAGDLWEVTPQDSFHSEDTRDEYGNLDGFVASMKVAKVLQGCEYHILVTNASAQEVLSSFDLSICRVGLLPSGRVIRGEGWTPVTEQIVKLRDTPTTQARLLKYQERFNHPRTYEFTADAGNIRLFGASTNETPFSEEELALSPRGL